jgi:hypothetical protein
LLYTERQEVEPIDDNRARSARKKQVIRSMSEKMGPSQDPRRGKRFKALAMLVGLSLVVLIALSFQVLEGAIGSSLLLTLSVYAALAATLVIAGLLWDYGARHTAPSGADVIRSDRRAPVLYLRSFAIETGVIEAEQDLARVLSEIGPFVAIGNPGDILPPLGAARFYERHFASDGRDWQAFIREMLAQAALVLVVPSTTAGLAWELAQCRELLRPERLLILVHARLTSFPAIQTAAAQAGLALPDLANLLNRHGGRDEFIGIVAFKPDWTSYLSPFPSLQIAAGMDNAPDRERRLRQGMRAVLKQQDLKIRGQAGQSLVLIPVAIVMIAALVMFAVSRIFGAL